jgi:hypothetical protein
MEDSLHLTLMESLLQSHRKTHKADIFNSVSAFPHTKMMKGGLGGPLLMGYSASI